jgi:hypothetical protein
VAAVGTLGSSLLLLLSMVPPARVGTAVEVVVVVAAATGVGGSSPTLAARVASSDAFEPTFFNGGRGPAVESKRPLLPLTARPGVVVAPARGSPRSAGATSLFGELGISA